MPLLHTLQIRTDDHSTSRVREEIPSPSLTQRLKHLCALPPRCVRGVLAIGISLLLFDPCQLAFAQATHAGTTHATILASTQPDASGPGARATSSSASEAATTTGPAAAPLPSPTATISGTVQDVNGDLVPGATVVLKAASSDDRREVVADDNAGFKFDSVTPGIPYEVSVYTKGFSDWTSPSIVLQPSQFFLEDVHLRMEGESASVTVYGSTEEIAVEQVRVAEQQRVLGIIPNFYVIYDSANAVPLTKKLKFQMAMRVSRDPVTILGIGFMSAIDQAANRPDYGQGAKGYGQRFGSNAAGAFSDILIGGAILPSLLHQDPRYFYQGTGGTRSRLAHAFATPFICRGDNGHRQINFSSMGGDIGATALSMAYLPDSNRGTGMVFTQFGINTAERIFAAIAQEFIIPRFTPRLRRPR
jgi:Carboxypeptidase regulatory-like domain